MYSAPSLFFPEQEMPIFTVRIINQNVKEFAVNCQSQEEARVIVGQSINNLTDKPNNVLTGDNTSGSTEDSQADVNAKLTDYANIRLR